MRLNKPMVCAAFAGLLFIGGGCTDDDLPTKKPSDMSKADMAPDLVADMGPPACTTEADCTGAWAGWECVGGVCTDCDRGDLSCVCRANGTCKEGARCGDDNLCVACEAGVKDCPCDEGDTCGDGLTCSAGVCVTDTCTAGALECPCDAQQGCATASYCDEMNVCRACTSDIAGCACELDDTCLGDNYCESDSSTCAQCPADDKPERCACQNDSECDAGLACDADSGRCRAKKSCAELCLPFQLCDESGAGDPICVSMTCVDGYMWDGTQCVTQPAGESCDGRNGTTDKSTECSAQGQTCVELGANMAACVDTCEQLDPMCQMLNKECDEYSGATSALCGACLPGYMDDGAGGCVVDPTANCAPLQATGSIADTCAMRNQSCELLLSGGAQCGDCLNGFAPKAGVMGCVSAALCGGELCGTDDFCEFPQTGGAPACAPRACATNEAQGANGACVSCNITCDAQGLYPTQVDGQCVCASDVYCKYQYDGSGARCEATSVTGCAANEARDINGTCRTCNISCGSADGQGSRIWPYTAVDGSCMCETLEGFYLPFGGAGTPLKCDADGDGWINRTARETYETASNINQGAITKDEAILANFRCERREVDKFTLQNEWGQQRHISLCGNDLIDYEPGAPHGCTQNNNSVTRITLYEADKLDSDDAITVDNTNFPAYGGRKLKAGEVNSLTKACVTLSADFNLNGVEDIEEEHAIERTRINGLTFNSDEEFFFHSMSYFAELHDSAYVAPLNAAEAGSYVIKERSRCAQSTFPLARVGGVTGYWQQCTRGRHSGFDYNSSHVGFDFAHWDCSGQSQGSCALAAPPTDLAYNDADNDRVDDHGLCDKNDPMPNSPWRGMTHHSQFQCVVLKNTAQTNVRYQLAISSLYKDGEVDPQPYEFNTCAATDCSSGAAGCVESRAQSAYQPTLANITCDAVERDDAAVGNDVVGWVNVRYVPSTSATTLANPYVRGCIDESWGTNGADHYKDLCPGYTTNPNGVLAAGNPGDAGKLICSCGEFYAGENCELGCVQRGTGPSTQYLHVGGVDRGYTPAQESEYACAASGYCSLHPADAASGFEGGRRGYWMCGDFSVTRTLDDTGADTPFMEATNSQNKTYQLRGGIKYAPVKRELLQQSNCTTNCLSAF